MAKNSLSGISTAIRIFVGLVFLLTACLKIISINAFEIYVYSVNPFNLSFSFIFARLIISVELILGLMLIAGYKFKPVLYTTLSVLFIFSIFLLVQVLQGSEENCFCFGDAIALTPLESLGKNVVLIFMLFIIRKQQFVTKKFVQPVLLLLSAASIGLPFIISPPDNWVQKRYAQYNEFDPEVMTETLADTAYSGKHVNEGKKMICYFSMSCQYCKLTAGKITGMSEKLNIDSNIIYMFLGTEKDLDAFWEESGSKKFTYYLLPIEDFFKASGGHLPAIYFVDEGKVVKKAAYRTLNDKDVATFFGK